jgi:ATP-binding cassette subfamily B protein/subfamily B ATP-binding cassette protein MsbA
LALVLLLGGRQVIAGTLTVGGLLVFLTYMRNLQSASEGLLSTYGTLKPTEASIDRVMEILTASDDVPERADAFCLPPRSSGGRTLQFHEVTFGYEANRPTLREISLTAQEGEMIALVGETGAGKSTLVSLIPRFLDPWKGSVTIDGFDVRDMRLSDVRSQVGLVLQDPFILQRTIAENIGYAHAKATREEIVSAARKANAHEFIERLPQGYDTVVGQRGATLSVGEKQRLSIARAILRDSPILIFDEPTSALDAVTEVSLVETIARLKLTKIIFVIAHRLSTIRQADKIVVLEQGGIVETGTHDELMKSDGLYRRFSTTHSKLSMEVVA